MVKHMMKPLLLASLLALTSFALAGCGSDDDPVIREQSSTGTPKQPFSAELPGDDTSDVPVEPAEGRDIPGAVDLTPVQSQPQFRE